jgi:hypothetical protein
MNQAINAYQQATVSPEFRELERLRSKARHDEAQALYNAQRKEHERTSLEIARKALAEGFSLESIQRITNLDFDVIENLASDQ